MEAGLKTNSSFYFGMKSVEKSWPEGLLVLMYHSVGAPPLFHGLRGLYVTPQLLSRQIRELKNSGGIAFSTLHQWQTQHLAGRQVVLTFDDAYQNLFVQGLPVLRELGVPAITYVVASLIGKLNEWDRNMGARHEPLMDRIQLQEWIQAGHEIGSHGLTHRRLTTLSPEEARQEIVESKKRLEDMFERTVRHFCYPYGEWNEAVRDMVLEAGYETATSTLTGFNIATTDAFTLRRFLASHRRPWLAARSW